MQQSQSGTDTCGYAANKITAALHIAFSAADISAESTENNKHFKISFRCILWSLLPIFDQLTKTNNESKNVIFAVDICLIDTNY